jgi:ABC-type lipoprotein export system ATPase subunit
MLKLKRLTIHKHPRVQAGTELVFNDGVNVLLGVNGSGKTTLLELIVEVLHGRFEGLAEHEFHVSYVCEGSGAIWSVEFRSSPGLTPRDGQSRPNIVWSIQIAPFGGERVTVASAHDRMEVTYNGETNTSIQSARMDLPLARIAAAAIFELAPVDRELLQNITSFHVWNQARFDEATRWFDDGIETAEFVLIETAKGQFSLPPDEFLPATVARAVADQASASDQRDDFKLDDKAIPFLDQACQALGFVGASLQLELLRQDPGGEPNAWVRRLGELRFRFVKADGTRLRHDQLSFGQRRLFAFLYYAAIHDKVIVADELTNGLHHAMIGHCLDVIGERQAFLATQNPLLLDNLAFEDAEQVRRTFILCSTVSDNGRERMVWRNMTADEAENFFRDYKVGISHVNDILRNWGLW